MSSDEAIRKWLGEYCPDCESLQKIIEEKARGNNLMRSELSTAISLMRDMLDEDLRGPEKWNDAELFVMDHRYLLKDEDAHHIECDGTPLKKERPKCAECPSNSAHGCGQINKCWEGVGD